jgi:membrane fusion protein (multidrug efflux system)
MRRVSIPITLVAFAVGACGRSSAPSQQTAAASTIDIAVVASRKLNTVDRLPAQLLPYETVDIYPKVTGFLEEIRVDVGSRVKKGDVMMRLSAPELMAQKAQASAALEGAESQLTSARAKFASDEGTHGHLAVAAETPGVVAANDLAVAKQTVEASKGGVGAAEHSVAAARDALRGVAQMEAYLTIEAPFSGTVTRRNLHPGALVGPASGQSGSVPIIQLADTAHLRMIVPVPEAEVGTMELGQQVSFSVPGYLGERFHAPIARVSHNIDVQTRTMHVELDVLNADEKLSPGSFSTVTWPVTRSYPTLFVPISAVTTDQQRTLVIRVTSGAAEWVSVQTGQSVNGEIEVVGDLHPGDSVVRIATDSIRNGDQITVRQATDGGS